MLEGCQNIGITKPNRAYGCLQHENMRPMWRFMRHVSFPNHARFTFLKSGQPVESFSIYISIDLSRGENQSIRTKFIPYFEKVSAKALFTSFPVMICSEIGRREVQLVSN